jgi:tRNA (guanine-N7-)-methyltransferase
MAVTKPLRRIQSFVCRQHKLTETKEKLFERLWPEYGIPFTDQQIINLDKIFGRIAPKIIEIGFGDGENLLAMARNNPEQDFIGIEVYRRGISNVFSKLQDAPLPNLKIFWGDAQAILENNIADKSLEGLLVFFPDPWPKTKHHKRRLIQTSFIELLAKKLKSDGLFHMATDWQDYARHMMMVMSGALGNALFENKAGPNQYAERPKTRPVTKYERRGARLGHNVWDLLFTARAYTLNNIE